MSLCPSFVDKNKALLIPTSPMRHKRYLNPLCTSPMVRELCSQL